MANVPTSFEQALSNPQGRPLIDAIEDVLVSLRGKEDDLVLVGALNGMVDELERKTGYRYATNT